MRLNLSTKKDGVSLIVVLMFMMIATIAATATWKWITSESRSSSARMIKREAYQSAMAGIENARAWMTYHANDVGAIIRQYIDGGNKPISLDSRLRALQRAGQNYHVWLTGVNVEGSTYKLKVYSAGEARGNAKHREVAIFNVDGLYRIAIPKETVKKVNDFDYNYFGGTTINHGDVFARSLLVNGDLTDGNPASVDSNLIVTGNFKVSGNSVAVHGTACIGGYLDADNGIVGNNFYVNGDLKNLKIRALTANKSGHTINLGNSIYGNLYVNGNITAANGDQVIDGNLTLNGTWTTNMSGYNAGVRGDLCLGDEAQIYFPNMDREFKATGNVWMESDYPLWVAPTSGWGWWSTSNDDNYSKYNRINLGTSGKKVYVKTGHPWSDYNTLYNTYSFNEEDGKQFGCEGAACNGPAHKWTGNTNVKVFTKRDSKPNLYYLYNWNSSDLVTFDNNYYDDYWKKYLAVYKVDGHRFWDTYNSAYTLNYSSNQATGSPYCYQPSGDIRTKARPSCSVTPWFKVDGDFKTPFPGTRPADLTCAESAKSHCDSVWEKTSGCGGTSYLVSDPLKTGISFFESYANKSSCVSNLVNYADFNNFDFSQFNNCYTKAEEHDVGSSDKILYNGYLVIKITNRNIFTSSKGFLKGKFIFIFENDMHQNMKIPATSGSTSYLFMYFKDGLSGEILPADNVSEINCFIYTKNDINNVLFNQTVLKGSIYAAVRDETTGATNCAKVNNLTFNGGMDFNQELVDDLTDAGVLCMNDGTSCGGSSTGTTTEEEEEDADNPDAGKDRYFVSTAPQLSIHVESMYETRESQPGADDSQALEPSYILLPRVIYLPSDPYGELQDYYNIIALNGSTLKKSEVVNYVSCTGPGSISTSGKLFSGVNLTQGVYKCKASPSGYDEMPFWVVVGSSSRGDGEVSFEKSYKSMGTSETAEVNLLVSAHSTELKVRVNCPSVPSSAWTYVKNMDLLDNSASDGCTFKIPPSSDNGTYKLFDVTTVNATSGRLTFTLKPGTDYTLASPYYTDLVVSSTADINRSELSGSEIQSYCESHSGACSTTNYYNWPSCDYTGLWVEPDAGSTTVIPNEMNESWSVSIGSSTGTIELKDRSGGKCVVIIPDGDDNKLDKSTMVAGQTYTLKASAKAVARTLHVVFMGDVGSGNTPVINYSTATTSNGTCTYHGIGTDNACSISVFDGEDIILSLDSTNSNNDDFTYWQCSGSNCPSTDPLFTWTYDAFKVKDNETYMYVHFGESDKHCFIDEFKNGSVTCGSGEVEYCIDNCDVSDDAVCVGAVDANGTYSKSKWHLLSGSLSDIENGAGYITIKNVRKKTRGVNNKKNKVKVISTVTAGINGTMKALFRMPQATASYGRSSENIANSGFMLRSNVTGTEYLMLNVYVNTKGRMEAQVCTDAGSCLNGELVKDGSTKSVSTASMVMMSATVNAQNQLVVSAFTGSNYYGSPDEYSYTFSLNNLTTSYANRAHEYVGFSIADPYFKLYGIGWESADYKADCWDTPPTVKCSFAAKAQDGIVELDKEVVPWVGHSGWFNSKDCTPHYYYYNGNDAGCGSADANGLECSSNYYKFEASGQGIHGYGSDVKTAKASLYCTQANGTDGLWLMSAGQAHCGTFWTGAFTECSVNYPSLLTDKTLYAGVDTLTEVVIAQGTRYNLRGSSLTVTLDNPDKNEVELVLVSKHDFNDAVTATMWGDRGDGNDIYMSNPVKITGNVASFDVLTELANGAEGFDPEKVRSIILMNHGTTDVTVKLISASCQNAVSVASCKAVYNDESNAWIVTTHINNIASASDLTLTKTVESGSGDNYKCGEAGVTCVKENGVATYTIPDNPYVNQGKHYYFNMSVSNGSVTDAKDCEVSPDPIGSISSECYVNPQSVQTGKGMPQFQFTLYGCPKSGCKYNILLGNEVKETGTASSGVQVKKTLDMNTTSNALSEGEYTYRVVQDGTTTPFDACSATFTVTRQMTEDEAVQTTCYIYGNNDAYKPGSNTAFSFKVNNGAGINITGREYKLELPDGSSITGSTGTNTDQTVSFRVPNVEGNVVLKILDGGEYKTSCSAELKLMDVSPKNCTLVNNNQQFRAHFNNVCENGACTWKLMKSYNGSVSLVSSGNVDRNDVDVYLNGLGVYTMWVNDTEYESCSITVGPTVVCPSTRTFTVGQQASLTMSSVTGCNDGCDYEMIPISGTGLHYADKTDGSYYSASNAITFTAPDAEDSDVGYKFVVSLHGVTPTLSGECTGTMNFVESSSCLAMDWTDFSWNVSNTGNYNAWNPSKPWSSSSCYNFNTVSFCCNKLQIQASDCANETITVNNSSITLNGQGYYDGTLPSPGTTTTVKAGKNCTLDIFYMQECSESACTTTTSSGSTSTVSSVADCNSGNSTSLGTLTNATETPNVSGTLSANQCYSIAINGKSYSANLQIGKWGGDGVSLQYKDCNGNTNSTTVYANTGNDGWNPYSISEPANSSCTIYVYSTSGGELYFNHW